jgi:hypothetical protein
MTTDYVWKKPRFIIVSTIAIILVAGCGIDSALAQSESVTELTPSELEEDVPVASDAVFVPPTPAPWFQIEQLNGDNLAVGDFVVGPGRAEMVVQPGETVTTYISVANRISDNRTFEITVEDIAGSASGEASVVLLGDEVGPYTIKDYLTVPEKTFTLQLGERARLPISITIPPDAEPGGFYGSVLISTVRSDEAAPTGQAARSPIIARIGTLFFVTVPGEVVMGGEVKDWSLLNKKWWYERGPIEFSIAYENTGSVHLNPYGELRIKNLFGEEVGFVELEPWFALPKSLRSRDIVWDRELLFGRYEATVAINRGYDDIVDERSLVFWVLPWKIVGGVFLVVFICVFCIRVFFRTFEFKRKS